MATGATTPASQAASAPASPIIPEKVPSLFRGIDWLAMLVTFAIVWVAYFLTIAPELTLEDSGELVTGSFYAGIPHPPGYPVWTIYSWLWTELVPWGNMAWRAALGQVFAGAVACGLIALMVSRGSSMLVEGIEELKAMTGKWENAICLITGMTAGLLMGFDSFMWSESVVVNRISVFGVPWILTLLIFLLRWMYAPQQYRYVLAAIFMFGVCLTIHQSLIVAIMGIQVAIAARHPRLGRDMFLVNGLLYLAYNVNLMLTGAHFFGNIGAKGGLLIIFHLVGLSSWVACLWLAIKTKGLLSEWKAILAMGGLLVLGVSAYLYMALSGMTNPPMQWGYPRTVEGFFHALTRGQYEQPNPTNLITEPGRFLEQMGMLIMGIADEFTWVYILVAIVPFLFFFKLQQRERAWLIGLTAIYFCLGVLLMMLLNPTPDRQSSDLVKVFFNASHTIVASLIGYGLALIAAYMSTHYGRFRRWGLIGGGVALLISFVYLWNVTGKHYFGPAGSVSLTDLPLWVGKAFEKDQYGLPIFAGLLLVVMALVFLAALVLYRNRAPLAITLGLFAIMPLYSVMDHWYGSEQRQHMFGYWFGHDMFTPPFQKDGKPIFPEMTKDAILFGGTDPGRFCPTYMIFCESFTPHDCQPKEDQKFDRRDVYIITQNALADGTYLNYIRAHYNRSREIDPPFFQELMRSATEKQQNYKTNLLARMVSPLDTFFISNGDRIEKRRRTFTSWFTEKDFIDLPSLCSQLCPGQKDPLSKYIYDNLRPQTQQLLAGKSDEALLRRSLAADLNQLMDRELQVKKTVADKMAEKAEIDHALVMGSSSTSKRERQQQLQKEIDDLSRVGSFYDPERFKHVTLSEYLQDFIKENPQSHTRVRLNRLLVEEAYPKAIAKSLGGVYPDREIYTPTPEDSQKCFQEYLEDAQKRMKSGQLKPGEDVKLVGNRVQVSGQVAVMQINALLTKVIFDNNPKNEFFVEESFPLDWMYPYLTPYGIIMKINRQPLPSLTEDILQRDHVFWKEYSKRFIGDFIDYDTSVKQVTDWVEKTYVRHNFSGFTGDRKFLRDDDAQKAFSKLRSSIGGVYAWRLNPGIPPEFRPKTNEEFQRLIKEANYTFMQAFAYCPYSPEAVFRYINLLLQLNRLDDAMLIVQTCLKLDPYNGQALGLLNNLKSFKQQQAGVEQSRSHLRQLEQDLRKNPTNFQVAFNLAGAYLQMQQPEQAMQIYDGLLNHPQADSNVLLAVVQAYGQLNNPQKLQAALQKLVQRTPENPEAWYDLASLMAASGKADEAFGALKQALDLNQRRLVANPQSRNLRTEAWRDARWNALRQAPEFQKLMATP